MKNQMLYAILFYSALCAAQTNAAQPEMMVSSESFGVAVASSQAPSSAEISASQANAIRQTYQSTAWFQSVDLTLKQDHNGNGFFSRLSVRFDANSQYARQPVYAIYSLISSSGYETIFHTSSIFEIYGASNQDWFAIDADMRGIARSYYKLRIQLKDAQTGYLLAEISGYDTASLDRLALEDVNADDQGVVVVHEVHGGAIGYLLLLGLSCLYWRRRKSLN